MQIQKQIKTSRIVSRQAREAAKKTSMRNSPEIAPGKQNIQQDETG